MSILLPILIKDFSFGEYGKTIVMTIFYFGMFVGAVGAGSLADRVGRRRMLLFSSFFQTAATIAYAFARSNGFLCFVVFVYGIVYGLSLPLSTTMMAEITPMAQRGRSIVLINACIGIGQLYGILLAFVVLEDIRHGDWRRVMLAASGGCFALLVLTFALLLESPRYLLAAHGEIAGTEHEGVLVLKRMAIANGADLDIRSEQVAALEEWRVRRFTDAAAARCAALCGPRRTLTLALWVQWGLVHVVAIGQLQALPFVLPKGPKTYEDMALALLGEFPAFLFSIYFMENKSFGRKNTLLAFFLLCAVTNLLCYLNLQLEVSIFFSRLTIRVCLAMLYVYTNEAYNTLLRTTAMGWACGVARISTCLMPVVLFKLIDINPFAPFLLFTFTSLISAWCAYLLPFDTTLKPLDFVAAD